MNQQGWFISLEGIDGCGKTTLLRALEKHFSQRSYNVACLREPGGTTVSEAIRQLLLNPEYTDMTPQTEAFLYAAARSQVCSMRIRPALNQGHLVLADRYIDSTLAYQGYGRELNLDFLKTLNQLCTNGLKPHLTLLLDLDPVIASQRRNRESSPQDRLEQEGLAFQQKVRAGYQKLAQEDPNRIVLIDANQPKEFVKKEAIRLIERRLFSSQI